MEPLYRFSPTTEATLHRAGWSPERRVDTEPYEALYRQWDIPLYPFVMEFLASLGGIAVYESWVSYSAYGSHIVRKSHIPTFEIDPFAAVDDAGYTLSEAWEGEGLVPFGESGLHTLLVYEDGRVVTSWGYPGLIPVSNSLVEFVESFCGNRT